MNAKNFIIVVVGAIFVAALLVWTAATRSARETLAALDAAARNRASLTAAIGRSESRIAAMEKIEADAQSALEVLRTATPTAAAPAAASKPASAPMAPIARELLAKDPMLQALYLNAGRARLAQEYGPFFALLQLTPQQIEQFTANVIKAQEQMVDLNSAAQAQGADSKQAVATLQKQANYELAAAQTALLGAEGYRQMKDYERSAQVRIAVEGLIGSATLESVPLTAAQAAQLTTALANATSRFASGGRAELATVNWDAAEAEARQILTPAQFDLFKSAAPINGGASRWYLQFDAAIARAKQADAATASSAKSPGM